MDSSQTLEEIEQSQWPEPQGDERTGLVLTIHSLRRKPLKDMAPADLHIMLSQQVSGRTLLPLALQVLQDDLLVDARFYPGDLLLAVLGLEAADWHGYDEQRTELIAGLGRLPRPLVDHEPVAGELERAIAHFVGRA